MGSCIGKQSQVNINAILPTKNFGQNSALLDKWSEQQVKLLSKKFNEFKTTEGLDFQGFENLLKDSNYLPKVAVINCFNRFALPEFKVLNFRNFCVLIAQIFLSTKQEKAELIFRIFDDDNDGFWTFEEKKLFNESYANYCKTIKKSFDRPFESEPKIAVFIEWCMKNLDFDYILKPFELIPSPDQERKIISQCFGSFRIQEGLSLYILSSHWWETWKTYVNYGISIENSFNKSINIGDRPVAIDNSALISQDSVLKLKQNLKRDKDFIPVSEEIWKIFLEWYGGGPEIERKVIISKKTTIIELYPPILTITPVLNSGNPATTSSTVMVFSLTSLFSDVLAKSCEYFSKPTATSRLWIKSKNTWTVALLTESLEQRKNAEEILFESLVFENNKSYWPRDQIDEKSLKIPSNTVTASSSNSEDSKRSDIKKISYSRANRMPGIVGLINLGNTCYFNSIIQALVHTPLLQEFFAGNISNFMNQKFELENTISYEISSLSKEMWNGSSTKINPSKVFNSLTSRFPMFEGKEQHDCHELLSMLLDTLHEELRREGEEGRSTVILENPSSKQAEIMESDKQWQLLQGTQGSIISDICAGQTKTTLTCMNCGSKRIIFEIFTNLSLPIPIASNIPIYITVVPLNSLISKIGIIISKHATVSQVLEKVALYSNISIEKLTLIEVSSNYSITILDSNPTNTLDNLTINAKAEIFAYEIRKTIKDCEELGKKTLEHNSFLSVGSQIDILQGNTWTTGKLLEIRKKLMTEYFVEYDYEDLSEWKPFSQINVFRKYTSSSTSQACQIFMFHTSFSGSRKVIGFPLILSIGNWYTKSDFYELAYNSAMRMVSKDIKPSQNCFKLLILDPITLRCGLCRSLNCTGCALIPSKSELKTLSPNLRRICIAAEWNETYFSKEIKYDESVIHAKDKEKEIFKAIDINMCLDEFTKEEKIDMLCENCRNRGIKMTMEIWRAPDILILSLKRFTYYQGSAEKIQQLVNYPFCGFDISAYVKNSEVLSKSTLSTSAIMNSYDLYSVVLHTGSIHGGHYTTLNKFPGSNSWILYDDDVSLELRESPENSNLISNSYLLFYRRRKFSSSNVINLTYNSL